MRCGSRACRSSRSTGGSPPAATWTWSRHSTAVRARAPPSTGRTPRWSAGWTRRAAAGRRGAGRDVVPGLSGRTLLHCGPAIDWAEVCDPLRRSMRAAVVAEGWAEDVEQADRLLADGEVQLGAGEPARDGGADGHRDRPVGAGVGGRQPRRRHPGLRPDQPGAGGDRLVRPGDAAAIDRLRFLRDVAGPMLRPSWLDRPDRLSRWPRRASRWATTSTCGPRPRPTC